MRDAFSLYFYYCKTSMKAVEVGLMVKTWGNGGFLEVDFKESQAIISNK